MIDRVVGPAFTPNLMGVGLKEIGDGIFDRNVVNVRMVIPLNRHQNHIKAER